MSGVATEIVAPVLADSFGRQITDLRISVTDRCNYRCVYCRDGRVAQDASGRILNWDDLERLARVFVGLGIRKIRLTGGEPLLRTGLGEYVAFLAGLGLADIALTTNGHLLEPMAAALRAAGLSRVTISLDSLQPEKLARITRVPDGLPHVLAAIEAAKAAGLPVKVNVVLLRGVNDDEIEALAGFARQNAVAVRFIEFMPLEQGEVWTPAMVVPMREIVERIARVYPLTALPRRVSETACRYRFADGSPGEIGIIAPVTSPFCNQCSRIRLTADGRLRTCLFSLREWDLRPALAASDAALAERIVHAVKLKEERHHIGEPEFVKPARGMVQIGG